ncbi:MAG: hypothetical protein IT262_08265 [Saprospiraceae bacterium]|nr:hypothetical protein [Saprospiraceae bacterium]
MQNTFVRNHTTGHFLGLGGKPVCWNAVPASKIARHCRNGVPAYKNALWCGF